MWMPAQLGMGAWQKSAFEEIPGTRVFFRDPKLGAVYGTKGGCWPFKRPRAWTVWTLSWRCPRRSFSPIGKLGRPTGSHGTHRISGGTASLRMQSEAKPHQKRKLLEAGSPGASRDGGSGAHSHSERPHLPDNDLCGIDSKTTQIAHYPIQPSARSHWKMAQEEKTKNRHLWNGGGSSPLGLLRELHKMAHIKVLYEQ